MNKSYYVFTAVLLFLLHPSICNGQEKKQDQFSIFNPVPIELMRDMETDRPDVTESPITVDAGHFQLETDLIRSVRERSEKKQTHIDFTDKNKYEDYMNTILKYCLEENVDNDFRVQKNTNRKCYHAPWMHNDDQYIINTNQDSLYVGAGREALRGLTQEITSKPGQIHDLQTHPSQTWAVSFYNKPGGYTFGKVWRNCCKN